MEEGGRIRDKRVTEITQSRNKKDTRQKWEETCEETVAKKEIRHVSGRKHPAKAMMADGTFIAMEFAVTSDKSQVFFFYSWMLRQTEQESNEIIVLNLEISDYKYILNPDTYQKADSFLCTYLR